MSNHTIIRKIFEGRATRQQMFSLFDRHAKRPTRGHDEPAALYAGEWFEISEAEHDYMFEILPPLWIRGSTFAMREFMTGSVTSVFFALRIDGLIRYFHGYCDLFDSSNVEAMRLAIIERESRPVRTITRDERLEHIWSITADAYRGYAGDRWPPAARGQRTVMLWCTAKGTTLKLLTDLTEDEVAAKLPVQFRYLPDAIAA
ncbi:DUF1419 domain-containing protein [Rhizobium sp. Root651]|uniref:DUF1419 domain-containing protein n=1 Tax=Rhizobium sp. Root651 TaxID=1736577 RepID=UPI0007126C1B|nr:DUF1419 domain-containing protein [Rhizobium sp. Root651]KRA65182.1 hypothetical protein ASD85_25570 [Rhizobium sp. Root651]